MHHHLALFSVLNKMIKRRCLTDIRINSIFSCIWFGRLHKVTAMHLQLKILQMLDPQLCYGVTKTSATLADSDHGLILKGDTHGFAPRASLFHTLNLYIPRALNPWALQVPLARHTVLCNTRCCEEVNEGQLQKKLNAAQVSPRHDPDPVHVKNVLLKDSQ